MRVPETLLLTTVAFLVGYGLGRGSPSLVAPAPFALTDRATAAPVLMAALTRPPAGASAGLAAPPAAPRHERLAERAHAGDTAATLELMQLLETCTLRDETRDFLRNHLDLDAEAPPCDSPAACAGYERVYDEFRAALAQWRAAEADCRDVPETWLRTRGRWLEQLAATGDTEARVCYALTGAELAPPPQHPDWPRWMDAWKRHGPLWAWDAWQRGDARAALALARIYGPNLLFGGPSDLADTDVRIAYRYALLLTRALELDASASDVAALAADLASAFTLEEQADIEAWVDAELARLAPRLRTPSRLPDACWQHFAVFETAPPASALAGPP